MKRKKRELAKPVGSTRVLSPNLAEAHLVASSQRAERWLCVAFLALLGGVTFFANLGSPAAVVFDEVHFGKFATSYCCSGERIFDIHPPHAKELIAATAYIAGFRGGVPFLHIGEPLVDERATYLRIWPALAGFALPLLVLALLCRLGAQLPTALLGGLATAVDNGLLVQSRHILLDSTLLAATFGALWLFLLATTRTGLKATLLCVGAGLLAGLAVGTKLTGLVCPALLGVVGLYKIWRSPRQPDRVAWLMRVATMGAAAIAIYLLGWAIHFAVLGQPGSGDAYYVPTGDFWTDLEHTHQIMIATNYGLGATHPFSSPWWSWPFMSRPILYWVEADAAIYFVGNPVVWWGATALAVGAFWQLLRHGRSWQRSRLTATLLCCAGVGLSFLPLIGVPRILFMYHYLPTLVFTMLLGLLWLDKTKFVRSGHILKQRPIYYGVLVALVAGFALLSPLTYGWHYSEWYGKAVVGLFPDRR